MARYATLLLNDGSLDGRAIYGMATPAALRRPSTPFIGGARFDAGFFEVTMPGGFRSTSTTERPSRAQRISAVHA